VVVIPANRAAIYWAQVKPLIWPAFEQFPGEVSSPEVLQNLLSGKMQLWIAFRDKVLGGAITQVVPWAEFNSVRIVALGGEDFEDWREPLDDLFTEFAKVWDCDRVTFHGRKGWERRLPNYDLHRIEMFRWVNPSSPTK